MQCAILAGGRGTRLRPFTDAVPKALVPVGGVPFADHQLSRLADQGVTSIVYCIGHLGDAIRDYVGDGDRWGLGVRYAEDGEALQGTAGALRGALGLGLLDPAFLVLYGDSYLTVDFRSVWHAFHADGDPVLLTVYRNADPAHPNNVLLEDGRVVVYDKSRRDPRSHSMRHIDYGLSVLERDVIASRVPAAKPADLADVYRELSREGRVAGFEVGERFHEVGSSAGVAELERFLASAS